MEITKDNFNERFISLGNLVKKSETLFLNSKKKQLPKTLEEIITTINNNDNNVSMSDLSLPKDNFEVLKLHINLEFEKLYLFSHNNEIYYRHCSFSTFEKTLVPRFEEYKNIYLDTEIIDFLRYDFTNSENDYGRELKQFLNEINTKRRQDSHDKKSEFIKNIVKKNNTRLDQIDYSIKLEPKEDTTERPFVIDLLKNYFVLRAESRSLTYDLKQYYKMFLIRKQKTFKKKEFISKKEFLGKLQAYLIELGNSLIEIQRQLEATEDYKDDVALILETFNKNRKEELKMKDIDLIIDITNELLSKADQTQQSEPEPLNLHTASSLSKVLFVNDLGVLESLNFDDFINSNDTLTYNVLKENYFKAIKRHKEEYIDNTEESFLIDVYPLHLEHEQILRQIQLQTVTGLTKSNNKEEKEALHKGASELRKIVASQLKFVNFLKHRFENIQSGNQQTETDIPTIEETSFENKFDRVTESDIIDYFTKNLVDKKYITDEVLNKYLKQAFELKIPPQQKFNFINIDSRERIVNVFYRYYKDLAGKTHGRQPEYLNLLKNYFTGFEKINIRNFSR